MIALWGQEDLGLMAEAAEGLAVQDAVPVPLERRAERVGVLGGLAPLRVVRPRRLGRESLLFEPFDALPDAPHALDTNDPHRHPTCRGPGTRPSPETFRHEDQ